MRLQVAGLAAGIDNLDCSTQLISTAFSWRCNSSHTHNVACMCWCLALQAAAPSPRCMSHSAWQHVIGTFPIIRQAVDTYHYQDKTTPASNTLPAIYCLLASSPCFVLVQYAPQRVPCHTVYECLLHPHSCNSGGIPQCEWVAQLPLEVCVAANV